MSPTRKKTSKSSLSVSSLKEKTRQGLKRLTSKGTLKSAKSPSAPPPCSPAAKTYASGADENTPERKKTAKGKNKNRKSSGKGGNESPSGRVRMARRRVPVSVASALQEVKGNLTKAVENVSVKLKMTRRRSVRKTLYDPLVGDTPVKMYSPFSIETPENVENRRGSRPGLRSGGSTPIFSSANPTRRNLLDTPTGKFRQDLEAVTRGFEELHSLSDNLARRQAQNKQIWKEN